MVAYEDGCNRRFDCCQSVSREGQAGLGWGGGGGVLERGLKRYRKLYVVYTPVIRKVSIGSSLKKLQSFSFLGRIHRFNNWNDPRDFNNGRFDDSACRFNSLCSFKHKG